MVTSRHPVRAVFARSICNIIDRVSEPPSPPEACRLAASYKGRGVSCAGAEFSPHHNIMMD